MTKPKRVHVYPSLELPEGSFLPGVGVDGAEVSPELAAEWTEGGLARLTRPSHQHKAAEAGGSARNVSAKASTPPPAAPAQLPAEPVKE